MYERLAFVDESRSPSFISPCRDRSVSVGFLVFLSSKSRTTTVFGNQYLLGRYVDHRQHSHILICLITMSIWKLDAVCDGSEFFFRET